MVWLRSSATWMAIAGEIDPVSVGRAPYPIDDLDDVGARLTTDDQQHGALAAGPGGAAIVLDVVDDLATSRRRTAAPPR